LDREFDVLVLANEERFCPFGERPIGEFSERMQCPVVLLEPGNRGEIYLNSPATLRTAQLMLDNKKWRLIHSPKKTEQNNPCERIGKDGK